MIGAIEKTERERFARLCASLSYAHGAGSFEEGIGIYNEKRIHRILKRTLCEREDCFEIKVGRYTADVLDGNQIYEIQCGPLYLLKDKLEYYLGSTEYEVTVVHPIITKRVVIRADRDTGEVIRRRISPIKERPEKILPMMYNLAPFVSNPRFSMLLVCLEVEEYRFSEAVRYRKSGRYDSEVFPIAMGEVIELRGVEDYVEFLPRELIGKSFSASEYEQYSALRGIDTYSALKTLANIGLIERKKEGRKVIYTA